VPTQHTTVRIWNCYSLVVRDRRWNAVRERSQQAGFGCIFVPVANGLDACYLMQFRNAVVVPPTDSAARPIPGEYSHGAARAGRAHGACERAVSRRSRSASARRAAAQRARPLGQAAQHADGAGTLRCLIRGQGGQHGVR
jgi:hypothetical protein